VEKRPGDFVTDTLGGAQYYGNKVLKEYKEKYRRTIPSCGEAY
jgi:adenylyl cyclase-associated protein